MSLLHVHRSPSPSEDDASFSDESHSPRSRSLSECFFAVRGAAVVLPHSDGGSPTSSRGCDIEAHLQLIIKLLRPQDTLCLVVRLQSNVADHSAYLAVVSAVDNNARRTLLVGTDYHKESMSVGMVMPVTSCTEVSLAGDGGIRVSLKECKVLFRPVSVQTMWFVFQSLHRASETARLDTVSLRGCAALDFYSRKISSPDVLCTRWHQCPSEEDFSSDLRADGLRGRDGNESPAQGELRRELRHIMQSVDLEAVTSRDIRERLAETVHVDVDPHKADLIGCVSSFLAIFEDSQLFIMVMDYREEFVDREMLVILGQMDKPSQIFPYLYLGTEWNASNWDELRENNVGYILNMTQEVDNFFPHRFVYRKIWVADEAGTHLLSHWNQTYKFIKEAKESGKAVLVHCKKGISRSSSTVVAYAMKEYEWTLEDALDYVKQRRNCITPNEGFMDQLRMFGGALEASRNRELFSSGSLLETERRTADSSPLERSDGDSVRVIVQAFERRETSDSPPSGQLRFPLDVVHKRSSIQQLS